MSSSTPAIPNMTTPRRPSAPAAEAASTTTSAPATDAPTVAPHRTTDRAAVMTTAEPVDGVLPRGRRSGRGRCRPSRQQVSRAAPAARRRSRSCSLHSRRASTTMFAAPHSRRPRPHAPRSRRPTCRGRGGRARRSRSSSSRRAARLTATPAPRLGTSGRGRNETGPLRLVPHRRRVEQAIEHREARPLAAAGKHPCSGAHRTRRCRPGRARRGAPSRSSMRPARSLERGRAAGSAVRERVDEHHEIARIARDDGR